MSRGNERRPIVRDDADREKRFDWLRLTVDTYGWRLHAFVVMNNHDHLFVETPRANLSAGMQFFNGSYTSYFNRRYRRSGHLFQGRYKAQLVQEVGYYLQVSRYIHLNPVRAGCVERAERYLGRSYPGYHNPRRAFAWTTYEKVLGEFGPDPKKSRAAYRQFVSSEVGQKLASPFSQAFRGLLVGSETFVERIREMLGDCAADPAVPALGQLRGDPSLETIREVVAEKFGVDAADWARGRRSDNLSRAVAACLARRCFGYRSTDVAAALGYSSAGGVGQAIGRVEAAGSRCGKTVQELAKRLATG
jgi:REP element-mobilizing transposase RayT